MLTRWFHALLVLMREAVTAGGDVRAVGPGQAEEEEDLRGAAVGGECAEKVGAAA